MASMLPKTFAKFLAVVSPTSSMPSEKTNLYNSMDADLSIDLIRLIYLDKVKYTLDM